MLNNQEKIQEIKSNIMEQKGTLLAGKRGLVMGVANDRSIAWGIAKTAAEQGAELAFTYQGEALERRIKPLAESVNSKHVIPCDVTDSSQIANVFETLNNDWSEIDFVVHAIAFSDREQLKGRYVDTTADNFLKTMQISCFSFTEVCKYAKDYMPNGGSMLTLSYYGAEKVVPHYNVMGVAKAALEASVRYLASDLGKENIRVNSISAGPIKTLAAAGVGDFRNIMKWNELAAPLRRNITIDDVGNSALYLLSDLSNAVTGENHYVDSGYNINGLAPLDAAEEISDFFSAFAKKSA